MQKKKTKNKKREAPSYFCWKIDRVTQQGVTELSGFIYILLHFLYSLEIFTDHHDISSSADRQQY